MSGCESGSNNSTDEGGNASFAAKIRFIVIRRRLLLRGDRDRRLRQRSQRRSGVLARAAAELMPREREEGKPCTRSYIARRYERASIGLTTNLAFMDWTRVFPDPMTASAVVDRLVHHGMVFEFSGESHRLLTMQAAGDPARPGNRAAESLQWCRRGQGNPTV